jgi:hypothetical protein
MTDKNQEDEKEFQAPPPPILVWEGQSDWQKPRQEVRYFHNRKVDGWSGYVKTAKITGWVDNVRIALFVEKYKRDHGDTDPTNDEILDWMVNDPYNEFALQGLAESIVKNGIRQQIVVQADGTLLDGNRRYFASLYKLRESERKGDASSKQMVSQLPVFVTGPSATAADLDAVVVEENFVDDCRRPWPNFIKAQHVFRKYQELKEDGFNKTTAIAQLLEHFGEKRSQIDRWIRMMNYIEEFQDFHVTGDEELGHDPKDEYDVKWRSQERFEYFDELTKPEVKRILEADAEMRDKVFERLYAKDFKSFAQIRKIPAISKDSRARDKFMVGDGAEAVEDAIQWVTITGAAKRAMDVQDRIMSFAKFLGGLTVNDLGSLDVLSINALKDIARNAATMAESVTDGVEE